MKVLLVDDENDIRSLLKMLLTGAGHEVVDYFDGREALKRCREETFPLIILDWELGEMNGIELCRRIRALPNGDHSVILMFTARNSPEDLELILNAGADDYLQKPVDIKWLKIRLKISEKNAENITARKFAEKQLETARAKEIDTGSRIQKNLLHGKAPGGYYDIVAHSIPSQKVDGDFYDFYIHNERCFDLVVGDVMGKGIPAALIGAGIKSQILHAINQLKTETQGEPPPIRRILQRVQEEVSRQLIDLGKFVTLSYVRFWTDKGCLESINCGHTRLIHSRRNSSQCFLYDSTNFPLGVVDDDRFEECIVTYGEGDVFLFYSDGITEARDRDKQLFGERRLVEFLRGRPPESMSGFVDALCSTVGEFSDPRFSNDDQTCVAVKIGPPCGECLNAESIVIPSDLKQLKTVRRFIQSFCERACCERAVGEEGGSLSINPIVLAMNEALSNVIRHACGNRPDREIRIQAARDERGIQFQLIHRGESFVPESVDVSRLDTPRESGMGLPIIHEVMDEVNYTTLEDGSNCIQYVVQRSKK